MNVNEVIANRAHGNCGSRRSVREKNYSANDDVNQIPNLPMNTFPTGCTIAAYKKLLKSLFQVLLS